MNAQNNFKKFLGNLIALLKGEEVRLTVNQGPWTVVMRGLNLVTVKAVEIANLNGLDGRQYRYVQVFEPGQIPGIGFQFLGVTEVLANGEEYVGTVCPVLFKDPEKGYLVEITKQARFGSGGTPIMEAARWSATNKKRPDLSSAEVIGRQGELGVEFTNTAVIGGEGGNHGEVLLMVAILPQRYAEAEYVTVEEFLDQAPDPHGHMAVDRALRRGSLK